MNLEELDNWKEELLEEIFLALAQHPALRSMLVYKGARVLNCLLDEAGRRSLDIDSNLLAEFAESTPDRHDRLQKLKSELELAISSHFDEQSPVQFSLRSVTINTRPRSEHPRGWDAYDVKISVVDYLRPNVRGLPTLSIDIAAPEALKEDSVAPLRIGAEKVWAYTIERIAGEKLRAFLSSLPEYRRKVEKPGEAVRVKDIYDLARIANVYPVEDNEFWKRVGEEFRLACESRLIDCHGLHTFEQDIETTRSSYEKDPTLPKQIPFDAAWQKIQQIVGLLDNLNIVPFEFPVN